MGRPQVLLGDDHVMFSEGLRRILEPHFEIVGTAENGLELMAAVEQLHPDVIVTDISMPLLNGIGVARRLQTTANPPKIIFLTMHLDSALATEGFKAGASGYVLKSSPASEVIAAIHQALRGHVYISPAIAGGVLGELAKSREQAEKLAPELTARQREVLQLIAEGKSPKEIAAILNVSPRTVEFHKYRIMEIVGARTIAELTRYAVAHGIV
jgi:DNA-binding NarL/FixJ family response regulator